MESAPRVDEERWDRARTRDAFARLAVARNEGTAVAERLRDDLVVAHLNLVRYLAVKFANRGEALDDLIQVGTVGLIFGRHQCTSERLGNHLLSSCVAWLFGREFTDILSGYRVFSRRYVKSFPALAEGFETETEFTVHALELGMPVGSMDTVYRERPPGSHSKLSTYRDGARILLTVLGLLKRERPLPFFGLIAAALAGLGVLLVLPVLAEFAATGLVPRLPTAVLSTGLVLSGLLALACGLILDTVTRGRREAKRIAYLAFAPPPPPPG